MTFGTNTSRQSLTIPGDASQMVVNHLDVYKFDPLSSGPLASLPPSNSGSNELPTVHVIVNDPHDILPITVTRRDWAAILVTLLKVPELYVLYHFGARGVLLAMTVTWIYFFAAAVILQYMQLSRGYEKHAHTDVDVLAGNMPMLGRPAGQFRILLGAPGNFRHHILWKLTWLVGGVINTASLVICYFLLSSCPSRVVIAWTAFQVLWVLSRSIFFHVGSEKLIYPTPKARRWERLDSEMRQRTLELLMALSMYQTSVHPRASSSYAEDVVDLEVIQHLFSQCAYEEEFPVNMLHSRGPPMETTLTFRAIIGDTTLSSTSWFCGSSTTPHDLYDACVAFFDVYIPDPKDPRSKNVKLLAVPCVRPLCSMSHKSATLPPDIEQDGEEQVVVPRGGYNSDDWQECEWVYWIPCSDGRWLQVISSGRKILGKCRALLLTKDELTKRLGKNELSIDIVHIAQLEEAVSLSRIAAKLAFELFRK